MLVRGLVLMLILIVGRFVQGQPERMGKIVKVEAGDRIQISFGENDTITLQLANVDCPEEGQPYFEEAKRFTEKMCLNKTLKFSLAGVNQEGIETGQIYLERNQSLNSKLIEKGLAWYFQKNLQINIETQSLSQKEEEAKAAKKGLWKTKDPVAPWIYKRNMTKYEAKTSI